MQLCEPDSYNGSLTMQLSLNILPTSIFNMDISKNITELQHIGISNWNVNKSKYYCKTAEVNLKMEARLRENKV